MRSRRLLVLIVLAALLLAAAWLSEPRDQSQSLLEVARPEPTKAKDEGAPVPEPTKANDESASVEPLGIAATTTVKDSPTRQPESSEYRRPGVIYMSKDDFLSEPRDDQWATPTESEILTALTRVTTGANLIEVECRTHQCRIEIVDDTCPIPSPFFSLSSQEREEFDRKMQQQAAISWLIREAVGDVRGGCMDPPQSGMAFMALRVEP